jgi:putative membrane protein
MLLTSLQGLPSFLIHLGLALTLTIVFVIVYMQITPYPELKLIREGNPAAAASLSGATLGYVLPLASAIAHSVNWMDMLIWGGVAFVVQVLVYFLVRLMLPNLIHDIPAGRAAAGIYLGVCALAAGILNAASMTY